MLARLFSSSRFHPRSLSRALMHLERAVSALGDADRTLADAGAADAERAAIARAVSEIFEQQNWIAVQLRYATPAVPLEVPDDPAAHSSAPPPQPSVASAVRQLFGADRAADLETEFGQLVTARLIALAGDRLTATAPRLTLRPGMGLAGRMIDGHGVPWRVSMTCHEAVEQEDQMHVMLDVTGIDRDEQRQTSRLGIDTSITLSVVACSALREGDEVRGQLVNLSRSGLAFSAAADLKTGDRLTFHIRVLEGAIDGEVRKFVIDGYERAKNILTENREALVRIAQALLETPEGPC